MWIFSFGKCPIPLSLSLIHIYLAACLLWQRFRPVHLPGTVVLSTSSIALQGAIMSEYIPFLSRVLLQEGILERPICAVIRKGKERFVCEARLAERMAQVRTKTNVSRQQAVSLRNLEKTYDLDEAPDLSGFDRRHVCVPPMCPRNCTMRDFCRYQQYLRAVSYTHLKLKLICTTLDGLAKIKEDEHRYAC